MAYQVKLNDEVKMTFSDEQQAKDYAKSIGGIVVPLKQGEDTPLAEELKQGATGE